MENREELVELMRQLVREEPETAAQILARLVTRFEVRVVVHRQESAPERVERWGVTMGEVAGPEVETH
ncbi:hypothetical protein [Anaerolinea sp.]|uniref:hypothetical protein n=1 Tax=Anaerolinea sp. TaxID=1872519 RepID=UPI002ACED04A|nr:hypothetical protein [Anaerolinea sp.]